MFKRRVAVFLNPEPGTQYEIFSLIQGVDLSLVHLAPNPNLDPDFDVENWKALALQSFGITAEVKKELLELFPGMSSEQVVSAQNWLKNRRQLDLDRYAADSWNQAEMKREEQKVCEALCAMLNELINTTNDTEPVKLDFKAIPFRDEVQVECIGSMPSGDSYLMGGSGSEAKLLHFDQSREILEVKWMDGRCVYCFEFLSDQKVVFGTSHGQLVVYDSVKRDIEAKRIIDQAGQCIKVIRKVSGRDMVWLITTDELMLVRIEDLQPLASIKLDFEAWALAVVGENLLAVGGSHNTLELFSLHNDRFLSLGSVREGQRRSSIISSLLNNPEQEEFYSVSEEGYLDVWLASLNGLARKYRLYIGARLYDLVGVDKYIAFSAEDEGVFVYDTLNRDLFACHDAGYWGGSVAMAIVGGNLLVGYVDKAHDIKVASVGGGASKVYKLEEFPCGEPNQVVLNSQGSFVAVGTEGLVHTSLSRLLDVETPRVRSFVIDSNFDVVVFSFADNSFKLLDLPSGQLSSLCNDSLESLAGMELRALSGNLLLAQDEQSWICLEISVCGARLLRRENFAGKNVVLLSEARVAALNCRGPSKADPQYELLIWDLRSGQEERQALDDSLCCHFIGADWWFISEQEGSARIFNVNTGKAQHFNPKYLYVDADHVLFTGDQRLCLHLRYGELVCFDLAAGGRYSWKVHDQRLKDCRLLGFSSTLGCFIILDIAQSQVLAVHPENAQVKAVYPAPGDTQNWAMSPSGKFLVGTSLSNKMCFINLAEPHDASELPLHPWRRVENPENTVSLNNPSGQNATHPELLWLKLHEQLRRLEFNSPQSKNHRLDPWNFNLAIPDIEVLRDHSQDLAVAAFMGMPISDNRIVRGNMDAATVFHELLHVLQVNSTQSVFDYFYLVGELQRKRKQLLRFLAKTNTLKSIPDKKIAEYPTLYALVEASGEPLLQRLAHLDIRHMEALLRYFQIPGDHQVHTFQLIEGGAEVFGLCAAGFCVNSYFDELQESDRNVGANSSSNLYWTAYALFRRHGGKTPLLFIVISQLALQCGSLTGLDSGKTPPDIFWWCMSRVVVWEEDLASMGLIETASIENFGAVVTSLVEQVRLAIGGKFFLSSNKSVHERDLQDEQESPFNTILNALRARYEGSHDIAFLANLVLSPEVPSDVADIFAAYQDEAEVRRDNQVLRDYEYLLSYGLGGGFKLYCCPVHGEVDPISDWDYCVHPESFMHLLESRFGVELPPSMMP